MGLNDMLFGPLFAALIETPKPGRNYQITPHSTISLVFIAVLALVVAVGLGLAIMLIVRTCRGHPKDSSSSGRTCM